MKFNIPTQLTLYRIISTFIIITLLLLHSPIASILATIVFLFAMLTDFYDGLIARKYNQVSEFGKLIDPIADKILVLSIFILFIFIQPLSVSFILVLIMILRDITITAFRLLTRKKRGETLPAETLGKIKTTVQMFSILIIMTSYNLHLHKIIQQDLLKLISLSLTVICCIFSVVSGCDYLYRYYLTFTSRKE